MTTDNKLTQALEQLWQVQQRRTRKYGRPPHKVSVIQLFAELRYKSPTERDKKKLLAVLTKLTKIVETLTLTQRTNTKTYQAGRDVSIRSALGALIAGGKSKTDAKIIVAESHHVSERQIERICRQIARHRRQKNAH